MKEQNTLPSHQSCFFSSWQLMFWGPSSLHDPIVLAAYSNWVTNTLPSQILPTSMVLQDILVITKPISTYDMTILATKITQIGQLRPKLWYFFILHRVDNFSPSSFWWLFNVFTPNVHSNPAHFWSSKNQSAHVKWQFLPKKSLKLVQWGLKYDTLHIAQRA